MVYADVGVLWLCTPFLAVALQTRYSSPAGINSLVALAVLFLAYVFCTYLGQPEITGRREGLDLRTDPRWRTLCVWCAAEMHT